MGKVLFVCVHNTCRSIMAETIFNSLARTWRAESAGIKKSESIDYVARVVLIERGYRVDAKKPRTLEEVNLDEFNLIVAVCDNACIQIPSKEVIRWNVEDPAGKSRDEYRKALDKIERLVKDLINKIEDV